MKCVRCDCLKVGKPGLPKECYSFRLENFTGSVFLTIYPCGLKIDVEGVEYVFSRVSK